jgi:hypothetical protein
MTRLRVAILLLIALGAAVFALAVWRNWGRNAGNLVVDGRLANATVAGRWQLQSTSMLSVTNRTGTTVTSSELTLLADGHFAATEFPVEDGFSTPKWHLKSGNGNWELCRLQHWTVSLEFADGFSFPLDIRAANESVVALTYSVGDPDSSEIWTWRRVAPSRYGDARSSQSNP